MASPAPDEGYTEATIPMRTLTRRPPPNRRRTSGWWLVPMVLLIVVLAALLGGLTYLDQRYAGRIYPGVSVQGVNVADMELEEAETALRKRFERFMQAPVRFRYNGRNWEPTAEELGLRINLEAHAAEALRVGRGNGLIQDVQQIATIWQQGLDLPLRVSVDAGQVRTFLLENAGQLEQPAREASLMVDTTEGQAEYTESAEGRMLLLDETIADVLASLETLEPQEVAIRTSTLTPGLTSDDIAEARRTVEAMLQDPMELLFKEHTFEISRTDIADMIVISRVESGRRPTLNAQLDQRKLNRLMTRIADKIGRDSIEPRVSWNGGNLQIVREGRSAYRLDIERAVDRFNTAVLDSNRTLDLLLDELAFEEQPRVTPENLHTLGIQELVGTGMSDFSGSAAYRITNIRVGTALMEGILIPPDGEFSFNENVGAIDESQGFVDGYAIVGNRTQKEPGGGICQVSTTLFRAAFYAGLPFTEWHPHRFRISWYEKYDTIGMDSTIFTGGGPDLRFVNDTGNWILIEGIADEANATVVFNLYGTKVPGRTVERSEPRITNETPPPAEAVYIDDPEQPQGTFAQTDVARGGLDIEIVRTVYQDGQVVRSTPFITRFQPWPNIFLKNPNTPVPPGGRLGSG
jgi:vancomycin resistance protein YoaR